MTHTYIKVTPKKGKDASNCSNYQPIALLNSDLKILGKILANWLLQNLLALIHKDQVGLLILLSGDNTCSTKDLIDILHRWGEEGMATSLDAEQVFDRLSWPFRYVDTKGPLLYAILALHTTSFAHVKFPYATSTSFPIRNGQVYPLSPLLFFLCIDLVPASILTPRILKGLASIVYFCRRHTTNSYGTPNHLPDLTG